MTRPRNSPAGKPERDRGLAATKSWRSFARDVEVLTQLRLGVASERRGCDPGDDSRLDRVGILLFPPGVEYKVY